MTENKQLRILILAPGANPNSVTGALIGYSHAEALARLHNVTLVIRNRNEEAVRMANADFHAVETIKPTWIDRVHSWLFRRVFKGDRGNLLMTALSFPVPIAFELSAWKQLRDRIKQGDFDVVLRLTPIVPMMASPFAFLMRKLSTPFVIGPLNGGVPWPKGFSQIDRQRAAPGNWAARFRNLYWYLPFSRSTYREAAAIVAGSSHTCNEFAKYRRKVFYIPGENGLSNQFIQEGRTSKPNKSEKLKLVFAGRLVPYKACDLAIRGAASLLRTGKAHLDVLGDGPELQRFKDLADSLGVGDAVSFSGMLSHPEARRRYRESDVLLFPSLREFGGGVVFEALAMGAVPIVADHGGPGDIVTDKVGYPIPLSNEDGMVADIETALAHLAHDRKHLEVLQRRGQAYAEKCLTWDAKARMMTEILLWATHSHPKPDMPSPKPWQC